MFHFTFASFLFIVCCPGSFLYLFTLLWTELEQRWEQCVCESEGRAADWPLKVSKGEQLTENPPYTNITVSGSLKAANTARSPLRRHLADWASSSWTVLLVCAEEQKQISHGGLVGAHMGPWWAAELWLVWRCVLAAEHQRLSCYLARRRRKAWDVLVIRVLTAKHLADGWWAVFGSALTAGTPRKHRGFGGKVTVITSKWRLII